MRASLHCVNADDLPGRCETVMGLSEDPLGTSKLGLQRTNWFRVPIIRAVEIPQASAVGDEVEAVMMRPFMVRDGILVSAGYFLRIRWFSDIVYVAGPGFGAVQG